MADVRKIRGRGRCTANTVDNLNNPREIANRFADSYKDLFNTVHPSEHKLEALRLMIDQHLEVPTPSMSFSDSQTIKPREVAAAAAFLNTGKNNSDYIVMSDHLGMLVISCSFTQHYRVLFSAMPNPEGDINEMHLSTVMPISKTKHVV